MPRIQPGGAELTDQRYAGAVRQAGLGDDEVGDPGRGPQPGLGDARHLEHVPGPERAQGVGDGLA